MGFANPFGLAFGALLGVLVLLYLWERQRRRIEVPSLLLWRLVPEEPVQLQRFRPNWLFWLQAALLTALVGGLARPYLAGGPAEDGHRRRVLVVDTSASMQAREGRQTRFEEARDLALEQLSGFGRNDEVMIVTAAARAEVVLDFSRDHAAAEAALRQLEPADTGTNLAPAIAIARRARDAEPDRTVISLFTDLPATAVDPADRPLVRHFAVGETSNNVGISSLQLYQGPFEDPRRALSYVLVSNYSYGEVHGVLTVALNGDHVSRTGFTIPGRGDRTFSVQGFGGPGLVTAHLDIDDALAADNRAYDWIRAGSSWRFLLVSPPSALAAEIGAIADVVPEISVDVIPPAEWPAADLAGYDAVLFHRVAPERPPIGALYIYPPVGNEVFPVVAQARDVEVMDWNERHESLRGLRPLPAWPLTAANIVEPPPGSQPLLWSRDAAREFSLAFTEELPGGRVAVVAFDLEAERLLNNDNVPLLVFFLNLLHWLTPQDRDAPEVVTTGSVLALEGFPENLPLRVEDPRQRTTTLPPGTIQLDANLAGLYRLSSNGTARTVLANFFDPVESDIGRGTRERPAPFQDLPLPAVSGRRETFGWWLYAVAAALMLSEWIAWRRTT